MEAAQPRSTEPKRWKKVRDVFTSNAPDCNPPNAAHRRWNTVMDAVAPMEVMGCAAIGDPRLRRSYEPVRSAPRTRRNNALDPVTVIENQSIHTKLAAYRHQPTAEDPRPAWSPTRRDSNSNRRISRPTSAEDEVVSPSADVSRQEGHQRSNTVIGVVTTMAADLADLMEPPTTPELMPTVEEAAEDIDESTTTPPQWPPIVSPPKRESSGEELRVSLDDSRPVEAAEGSSHEDEELMATTHSHASQNEAPDDTHQIQNEPTDATQTGVIEGWGSPQDIESLNREILSCLEVEGIPPPLNLFVESVDNFRSVSHYYVNAMKLLDGPGIDLLASLSARFGEDHGLVKGMKNVMARMSNVTFIRREPTVVREERHRIGDEITMPGLKQFSDECRSLSWVVRTTPLPTRQQENDRSRHRERLDPIMASIGGSSYRGRNRGSPKEQEAQIVCPGLPVSFDGYEQPPPRAPVAPHRSTTKKPFLSRVMSCLCFAS